MFGQVYKMDYRVFSVNNILPLIGPWKNYPIHDASVKNK